jgi:hypothetical protein
MRKFFVVLLALTLGLMLTVAVASAAGGQDQVGKMVCKKVKVCKPYKKCKIKCRPVKKCVRVRKCKIKCVPVKKCVKFKKCKIKRVPYKVRKCYRVHGKTVCKIIVNHRRIKVCKYVVRCYKRKKCRKVCKYVVRCYKRKKCHKVCKMVRRCYYVRKCKNVH